MRDRNGKGRARVPSDVRDKLGARLGDTLIFEEGSVWAAENAAKRVRISSSG
jgi:bifunctional DNA-binding transcriptional regulator/antitoxin component of YhaV-PrlF toxin-antitoxin module